MCIGSLGRPCGYSSGMNEDGFCLVDTNIPTKDHGPGLCRYFLMGHLLKTCSSVNQAIEVISNLPHSGGGALLIADRTGDIAGIELGHAEQNYEKTETFLIKTNHFTSSLLNLSNVTKGRKSKLKNSMTRLKFINNTLKKGWNSINTEGIIELLKSHDPKNSGDICKHLSIDNTATISGAVYKPAEKKLYFSDGNPCNSEWYTFSL